MRDRELMRNGSGYYDPTAYEALRNIIEEDKMMQRGEIWTALFNGKERPVLVVTAADKRTSFILLKDERTPRDTEELLTSSAEVKYYNPSALSYKIPTDYRKRVGNVDKEQMQEILEKVRAALDLYPEDDGQRAKIERLGAARTEACVELGYKDEQIKEQQAEIKRLKDALTELNNRLEAEKAEHSQDLEDMQDQIDLVETDKKDSLAKLAEQSRLHNERMRLEHCGQIDALKAEAQDKIGTLEKEHAAEIQQLRERCAILNAERNLYHAEYKELLSSLLQR